MSHADFDSSTFGGTENAGEAPANVDWLAISPKPRTGGCSRVLVGAGIGCFLLIILGCGGLFVSGALVQQYAQNAFSDDPVKVTAMAREIAPIDVPSALEPMVALDARVPFTGGRLMTWAVFGDEATQSILMLSAFGEGFMPENQEEARQQFEESLRSQGVSCGGDMEIVETHERTFLIRGEPAQFTFSRGTDPQTGDSRLQLTGMFRAASGPAMLVTNVDGSVVGERELGELLLSLRE